MSGQHEAEPISSAARESTARPYIGKHRAIPASQGRGIEFQFGAITHQHMLSMGQARASAELGGSITAVRDANLSARATPTHTIKMAGKKTPVGKVAYN